MSYKQAFKEDDVPAEELGGNVGELCSVSYDEEHRPVLVVFHSTGVKEFRTYVWYSTTGLLSAYETHSSFFDKDDNFISSEINY